MPQLYFTDLAVLRRSAIVDGVTHELQAETIAAVEATGLSDGMPFVLDDCGGYDLDLNRFFRTCPTMGVRSSNSLRAYACVSARGPDHDRCGGHGPAIQ